MFHIWFMTRYKPSSTYIANTTTTMSSISVTSTSSTTTASSRSNTMVNSTSVDSVLVVPNNVNFMDWRNGKVWRYMLPQMLKRVDRTDKKDCNEHCSDAIVWNVLMLETNTMLPTRSPPINAVMKTKMFLRHLKTELNKVFIEETQRQYWTQANQPQWSDLKGNGDDFVNFKDLKKRTLNMTTAMVRTNSNNSYILIIFYLTSN